MNIQAFAELEAYLSHSADIAEAKGANQPEAGVVALRNPAYCRVKPGFLASGKEGLEQLLAGTLMAR
ncbi:MAG: hypothetical protein QGH23_01275 [Dehalococcoidia bacterium]|nr:hypothetical protein [Dehalococcoidia bacterium]MDP6783229.1 hypothetical protein [Dehalococcoidia bacterium]